MFTFIYIHSTPTKDITIDLKATMVEARSLITYEDKPKFENLCKIGCPNYNWKWACPPFSPSYSHIAKSYSHVLLMLLTCELYQFDYTKTDYMKIKASNSILKSKSDKVTRILENKLSGIMISNGSCRLCKPCNRKKGLACKKPDDIRYSMEALGLNVGQISEDYFNHKLLWYKNKTAPKYSSVLTGVLFNGNLDLNDIKDIFS